MKTEALGFYHQNKLYVKTSYVNFAQLLRKRTAAAGENCSSYAEGRHHRQKLFLEDISCLKTKPVSKFLQSDQNLYTHNSFVSQDDAAGEAPMHAFSTFYLETATASEDYNQEQMRGDKSSNKPEFIKLRGSGLGRRAVTSHFLCSSSFFCFLCLYPPVIRESSVSFGALLVQRRRDHRSAECRQPHHQHTPKFTLV